jgi:alkylhydroperoxidase family enzyme
VTPRISPLPPDERDDAQNELLGTVGRDLNIFATLVRYPRLFRRWSQFGGVLLSGLLSPRERELVILRTGHVCDSHYEWHQHVGLAREAGITDEEIERVRSGPDAEGWDPFEATLLRAVDELHATNRVSDSTWRALAERFDDRQLIELCMLVGQYHLVAFTLNSLGVEIEPGL